MRRAIEDGAGSARFASRRTSAGSAFGRGVSVNNRTFLPSFQPRGRKGFVFGFHLGFERPLFVSTFLWRRLFPSLVGRPPDDPRGSIGSSGLSPLSPFGFEPGVGRVSPSPPLFPDPIDRMDPSLSLPFPLPAQVLATPFLRSRRDPTRG